jgi:hypothetical protein
MERFFNGGRKAALAAGLMLASVGMLTNPVLAESALNDMIMESAPHVNRGHPTTILPPPPPFDTVLSGPTCSVTVTVTCSVST